MKTIYQKPELNVIVISTEQHMMTGSGGLLGNKEKPNDLDLSNISNTTETSGNLGRRNVWDDEEEEEEVQ